MSTKLHNRIQTHIDNYNGEIITTDGKPPVNAKLTNFKLYGKSVQSGTPAPESPVPIESVARDTSIISTGKNLANWKRNWYDAFTGPTSTAFRNEYDSGANCLNIKSNGARASSPGILVRVKPNTNYTFSARLVEVIDTEEVLLGVLKKGTGEYYDIEVKQSSYTSLIVGDVYNSEFNSGNTDIILLIIRGASDLLPGNTLCKCDNIYLYEGSIDKYKDYIGSTTALNLLGAPNAPAEWIGQPISLMSLPDGTADEYKADEGVVIKRVSNVIFSGLESFYVGQSSSGWLITGNTLPFYLFYWDMSTSTPPKSNTASVCNRFYCYRASKTEDIVAQDREAFSIGHLYYMTIRINKSRLSNGGTGTNEENLQAFKDWLASNNVEVIYALETPITIPVVQQPTPKSVYAQPNNIYADTTPQPTISCGVRKLGNRPYIEAKIKDELGNFLVDENGNNIGGLY